METSESAHSSNHTRSKCKARNRNLVGLGTQTEHWSVGSEPSPRKSEEEPEVGADQFKLC